MNAEQERERFIDMDKALSRVRGNKSLYRKMLVLFLNNEEIAKLEKYLEEKNYVQAAEAAHGVKGMTGNLALPLLYEKSTKLMEQLRFGQPEPLVVEEYRETLAHTRRYVQELADLLGEQKE